MTVVDMPRKTPDFLPPTPKLEIDAKIKNLDNLTKFDLLELRERQRKLLSNKAFISKLPDKGEKILAFSQKIYEKLKSRDDEESTRLMLEKLNLNPLDGETVQSLEWKVKMETTRNTYLDSDDDSDPEDVLHVLSQNTSLERKIKVLKEDKSLITREDMEDIVPSDQLGHIKYIVSKTENVTPKRFGQYKPYKTTRTDVHDPMKEGLRKKHKNWEVTAATPPPSQNGPAKMLSMEDSLQLQSEQNRHLKEVETRHAAEKLMTRLGVGIGEVPASTLTSTQYREAENVDSESSDYELAEGSDNEVHDEEPERGGVVFTVMN